MFVQLIEMWYHVLHKMYYAGVYLISIVLSQVVNNTLQKWNVKINVWLVHSCNDTNYN